LKEKVAVIIFNWNGKSFLEQFLPTVIKYSGDAQIIVADNKSTDNSLSFLKQGYPTVSIIELAQRYGFAKGYNKALKEVEAEYYVLLNLAVEVTENWLNPMV